MKSLIFNIKSLYFRLIIFVISKGNTKLVENIETEINDIKEKEISIDTIKDIVSDIFEEHLVLCEKRKTKNDIDFLFVKIGESIKSSISHHLLLQKIEKNDVFVLKFFVPYLLKNDNKSNLSYKKLNDLNRNNTPKIVVFDDEEHEDGRIVIENTLYFSENSTISDIKKLIVILFKNVDDPDIDLRELFK